MSINWNYVGNSTMLFVTLTTMAGCLDSGSETLTQEQGPLTAVNSSPIISGNPPPAVVVGDNYTFTPTASDPDGDTLVFSIENRPTWASFDSTTGTLAGVASLGTEGTYDNIRITVSDGGLDASTPQFSINVTQVALGSATLSWTAPTQNTDGSTLENLAGYNIYYGTSLGSYPSRVHVDNPGLTTYVVENLVPDNYFFVSTAVNSMGMESSFSNVAEKMVN